MKAFFIILALSIALSASAAPQASHNEVRQFGNFGGGGRTSNNNGGGRNTNSNNNGGGRNTNSNNNGGGGGNVATNGTNNNQTAGGAAGGNNGGAAGGNNANNGGAAGNNSTDTGNSASNTANNATSTQDAQQSLTLDPQVIATGFANNGQDVPAAGQVASLTSTNNFINFCLTVPNLPITNGQQIKTGSCNPAPMGVLPSTDNMPSSKFVFPKNGDTIQANTAFTIQMAIQGMQTGFFVNAEENYFAAPQFLNQQGQIQGHSHVVVETLNAIDQTTPLDPQKFAFFKGLNDAAANGQLTADVDKGLPAGVYKLSSINAAANHQPVLVPIAQHGSLDDAVYFTVTDDGQPDASSGVLTGNNNTATANTDTGAGNNSTATGNTAAGNANTGAGNAGNTNAGAGNAGSANTGASNTGSANAGAGSAGTGNTGKNGQNQNTNTGGGRNTSQNNQNGNNGGRGFGGFGGFGGRNRRFARSRL